jgi:hypothetical protein
MVEIPEPYAGLSFRLGRREVNVHEVKDGIVYFGMYCDDAEDSPYRCTNLYQLPVDEWIDSAGRALLDGAVAFSRLVPDKMPTKWREGRT